ncbi:MAG: glycosyltransferase [Planctomycetota bacterium]|nr:glycosyltransferase [Planctomycetota bacterium]
MHVMVFIDAQRIREDGPMLRGLLERLGRDWNTTCSLVLPDDLPDDLHWLHEDGLGSDAQLTMPPTGPLWIRQRAAQSLAAQVHRDPPNAVLCIGTGFHLEAEATAKHLDCPVILSTWSLEETKKASPKMEHVGAWVAPTPALASRLSRRVGTEIVQCIHPGIERPEDTGDELGLAPTLALLACDGDPDVVQAVLAGLEPVVGVIPELQICMELDAADGHQAWRQADARGLLDHVSTIADATQVRNLLTTCDLIVHPHRGTRVRTMVLEAMAAGRAILSASPRELDWLIDGETARIVDDCSAESWSAALLNLLEHPGNRMAISKGAMDRIASHHDPDEHASNWASLLLGVSEGVSYPFTGQ